ncbi:hypothetical protein MK851_08250 [Tenacibaculum sp. 1B UA]|uniref:hypothetical protein n=1 Tax=Tenacibaculum sp. 1B UA TaxID=2922252 RepID=UPI002A23B613|nr:hypothetical protein [Tenacibaculum sp. 1B UA]MDX8553610.1 hypothetical protein [Tenacibaculum sp. 1B UA]
MSKKLINISVFIPLLFGTLTLNAQGFSNIPKTELIKLMVDSFENQICSYYSINPDEAFKAYPKYIKDIASNKKTFNTITTEDELELLKISKTELINYIWITNKDKRERSYFNQGVNTDHSKDDEATKEYYASLKSTDHILSINYFDEYSEFLLNKSKNQDLKDLIITFRLVTDSSSMLTASSISHLKENSFKEHSLRTFIVFELYYAILNTLNKNE